VSLNLLLSLNAMNEYKIDMRAWNFDTNNVNFSDSFLQRCFCGAFMKNNKSKTRQVFEYTQEALQQENK
jgi:hypothetical protein